jgi:hypothetical protein
MSAAPINDSLIKLLQTLRGRSVTVLLNRGNRGDGLIHLGGRQLFSNIGLNVHEVREDALDGTLEGDVLLVYGAGAFARGTQTLPRVLPAVASRFNQVVVLPSSFDLEVPAVKRFVLSWGPRYTVFCRELVSLDAVRSAGGAPEALLLGHDLAFHANLSEWAGRPHGGETGVFRTDLEATFGALPAGLEVNDASHGSDRDVSKLLDHVSRFSVVHTDRCHAAIAGALMGRDVRFYRNNYFKNQAIYEQSLARYPRVKFIRTSGFSVRQFFRVTYWARVRPIEMRVRSAIFRQNPAKKRAA